MKLKIILLLVLCLSIKSFGQDLQVKYKVQATNLLNTTKPDTLPKGTLKVFEEAGKNFKYVKFLLNIKDGQSEFFREKGLINEADNKMRLAIALAGFSGKVHIDKKENARLKQMHVYGQEFLISSVADDTKWELTTETKLIGDFETYKAVAIETYESGNGKESWEVVAWFAPEINRPFGPLGFGNLPGLIMELERGGKTYLVEKIKTLDLKEIEKPSKGKMLTQEEFDEIGRNIAGQFN